MKKHNISEYLPKLLELEQKSSSLKYSIKNKGKYKYTFLIYFLETIINEEINCPYVLLEIYKYFIRLRRFIFKWINFIEDFLTSIYVDIEWEKILNSNSKDEKVNNKFDEFSFYFLETFGKKRTFFKKDFYNFLIKNYKLIKKFENYEDFENRLKKIIDLRNCVSHSDIIIFNSFLVMKKNEHIMKQKQNNSIKSDIESSIINNIKNIEFFLISKFDEDSEECLSFSNQFMEISRKIMSEKDHENMNNEEKRSIINKVKIIIEKINNFDLKKL